MKVRMDKIVIFIVDGIKRSTNINITYKCVDTTQLYWYVWPLYLYPSLFIKIHVNTDATEITKVDDYSCKNVVIVFLNCSADSKLVLDLVIKT